MSPVPRQPNKKQTPRSRNLFRKTEIRRVVNVARAAGFTIQSIDVHANGKFSVVVAPEQKGATAITMDEVENWLREQQRKG